MADIPYLSRRIWLRKIFAISVAIPVSSKAVFGASKIAQVAVHYQIRPAQGKMCGMCRFFIPDGATAPGKGMMGSMTGMNGCQSGTCKLVAGKISPMGYCVLYSPVSA
ncbi:MAG TPA: hypothetical protein VFN66_09820 [Burkholderiales bacterium]|nr:hypothetical protein [Burkholderiales bacterium]